MEFKKIPDIVSPTGWIYEISKDLIVRSVSNKGVVKELSSSEGRIKIGAKKYRTYTLAQFAGWPNPEWPKDVRDWYEFPFTDENGTRCRILEDSEVQRMDLYGNVNTAKHFRSEGYIYVGIGGKWLKVHNLMGMVEKWCPKPQNYDDTWTIHHKNNDPMNNHKDNLIWASLSTQNIERRSSEQSMICSCPVIGTAIQDIVLKNKMIIKKGQDTPVYDSSYTAADEIIDGRPSNITQCLNNRRNFHAGFSWRTPSSDEDFPYEKFINICTSKRFERFISNYGRVKYVFQNGYSKIISSENCITDRKKRELKHYPTVNITGQQKRLHRLVVESFVGDIPNDVVIDHRDDVNTNASLGNLQILTISENNRKRHLQSYVMSVASFVEKKHEKYHDTKKTAIDYIHDNGYPDATLEELESALKLMAIENVPATLYGRTWIPAHFESYVKKEN